jgi:hypothetical protein
MNAARPKKSAKNLQNDSRAWSPIGRVKYPIHGGEIRLVLAVSSSQVK